VKHSQTRPSFARRVLNVALCYVIALQTLFAAYATASTITGSPALAADICHNVADGSSDTGSSIPITVPCVLCAIVAAGLGLPPAPILDVVAHVVGTERIPFTALTFGFKRPSVRTGLARAPPLFG
jgi:hypothetical protein